jgi:hypothetical protein
MTLAPEKLTAAQEDIDAITGAALDYLEGYITGDPERHARAYHSECLKRRLDRDEESGVFELTVIAPQAMVDYADTGRTIEKDCQFEVIIDAVCEDIATVRIYSCNWVDFLHIVKARGEWKLFHATWHRRQAGE